MTFKIARGLAKHRLVCASALIASCAVASLPATSAQAKENLTVVTGYTDDFAQTFAKAFETKYPDIAVTILHKSGRDALAFLAAEGHGGADVYWAASGNFAKLADKNAFAPLKVDRSVLPAKIGAMPICDPQGRYEAFELAGYGLAYALWKSEPSPQTWQAAARPGLAGKVIMPTERVGFASALYEIILQGEGWDKGWALLSEIAGNATLIDHPHGFDAIETGQAALSLTIDFHALDAAEKGKAIGVAYPQKTAFLPAYVAELAGAPHAKAAESFIAFLLSQEGQKLMRKPGINRYPVRPDLYAAGDVNPFKRTDLVAYDPDLTEARRPLDAALFDAAIVATHDKRVALWQKIHAAEHHLAAQPNAGVPNNEAQSVVLEARRLAGFVPVSQKDAEDKTFLAQFSAASGPPAATPAAWRSALDAAYDKALALLAKLPN